MIEKCLDLIPRPAHPHSIDWKKLDDEGRHGSAFFPVSLRNAGRGVCVCDSCSHVSRQGLCHVCFRANMYIVSILNSVHISDWQRKPFVNKKLALILKLSQQFWTCDFRALLNESSLLFSTNKYVWETENQTGFTIFVHLYHRFIFSHLQSGDKGLEWTKSLQLNHPPTRSSPSKQTSLQAAPPPPLTCRRPTLTHSYTHTHAS